MVCRGKDGELHGSCKFVHLCAPIAPPRLLRWKFWVAALLGIAYIEYIQINIGFAEPDPVTGEGGIREDYIPGDLGFDPFGLKPQEEAALKDMKTKELNHGRLAVSVDIPSSSSFDDSGWSASCSFV